MDSFRWITGGLVEALLGSRDDTCAVSRSFTPSSDITEAIDCSGQHPHSRALLQFFP